MKLATFFDGATARLGLVEDDQIVDIASAGPGLPASVLELLGAGDAGMQAVGRAARVARRIPLSQVKLGPPIGAPRKFLGLALSFRSHIEEMRAKGIVADRQMWFNKQVSCINGPYDDIHLPRVSRELDYEGELAFVIGRSARHVPRQHARAIRPGPSLPATSSATMSACATGSAAHRPGRWESPSTRMVRSGRG